MDRFVVSLIVVIGILVAVILLAIYITPEEKIIKVTNTNFSIKYLITGGELSGIIADPQLQKLLILIETNNDGKLTLTIPRTLLDAKIDNNDDLFFVIVDGEEITYSETKTNMDRTLTISFSKGNAEIEIHGTKSASLMNQ